MQIRQALLPKCQAAAHRAYRRRQNASFPIAFQLLKRLEIARLSGRPGARGAPQGRFAATMWRKHFRPLLRFRNAPFSPAMAS
jgi:hypothetical protein